MKEKVNIGIIGDFDENYPSHKATDDALYHAANYLSIRINISWLPTQSLVESEGQERLKHFSSLWAAPGSLYKSERGALNGIQFARELNVPFIGT